jgi:hypothetical protein
MGDLEKVCAGFLGGGGMRQRLCGATTLENAAHRKLTTTPLEVQCVLLQVGLGAAGPPRGGACFALRQRGGRLEEHCADAVQSHVVAVQSHLKGCVGRGLLEGWGVLGVGWLGDV